MADSAVPSSEEVTSYLATHKLEPAIEDAVNDAVLKQVKAPFRHIAEILLKKSEEVGEPKAPRFSMGSGEKKAAFANDAVVVATTETPGMHHNEDDIKREFVKGEAQLTKALEQRLREFFDKIDADGNGQISRAEAEKFWGKNYAKLNARSMFNEVDEDHNGSISWAEFLEFWQNVAASGYSEDELTDEVDMMMEGGSWVDFNDGRTT